MNKIKVLIVDDSALVRQMLSQILSEDTEIEVVGTAMDPIFAMQKIMRYAPDVITLDVEMPRMDGLTFLEKLMKSYPMPVVMISSYTKKGCDTTLRALELGAVDFIAKPGYASADNLALLKHEILMKVKNAARVNLKAYAKSGLGGGRPADPARGEVEDHEKPPAKTGGRRKVVAIGASTGGVSAVCSIVEKLRPAGYCILVTLHMPAGFTKSFAERLGSMNGWVSHEAVAGQQLEPGHIYVAPGGHNMFVERIDNSWTIKIRPCDSSDIFKPNVNKTFDSVAMSVGQAAVGVILTGMGDDGARGLRNMRDSGAVTIGQSEETCMVFGMPRKAIEAGAVECVVPLGQIPAKITQLV